MNMTLVATNIVQRKLLSLCAVIYIRYYGSVLGTPCSSTGIHRMNKVGTTAGTHRFSD